MYRLLVPTKETDSTYEGGMLNCSWIGVTNEHATTEDISIICIMYCIVATVYDDWIKMNMVRSMLQEKM